MLRSERFRHYVSKDPVDNEQRKRQFWIYGAEKAYGFAALGIKIDQ